MLGATYIMCVCVCMYMFVCDREFRDMTFYNSIFNNGKTNINNINLHIEKNIQDS